jgi:CheY-like chemotaxis protein
VKLLLVEDEAINVLFIKNLVSSHPKKLVFFHARNGAEALALAQQEQPEIILMDVGLPDISGLMVTQKLREIPEQQKTVIIGLTALSQPSDKKDCLDSGMNDVFPKPFGKQGFHNLLNKYLMSEI